MRNSNLSLKIILTLFFITYQSIYSKILILTIAYGRPDFIELQDKTFKKFLKDDYEFIVFNNAINNEMTERIEDIWKKIHDVCCSLSIKCIDVPLKLRWGSAHHVNGVHYALKNVGFSYPGIVAIIDSDMFLVKDFSIEQYMKDYDIAGLKQQRGHLTYIWPGVVFINMNTISNKEQIDFSPGLVDGHTGADSGGYMHYYLKNNPQARVSFIDNVYLNDLGSSSYDPCFNLCYNCRSTQRTACTHNTEMLKSMHFDDKTIKFIQKGPSRIEFLINNTFLHYRSGSQIDQSNETYHKHKTELLKEYLDDILDS